MRDVSHFASRPPDENIVRGTWLLVEPVEERLVRLRKSHRSAASHNKRIRKTFSTLSAAKGWRTDAMKALRDGRMRAPTPETVRQAGEALIAGMKNGSVRKRGGKPYKPSTIRSYEQSLKEHVYPDLGAHKTADVLFPDLQDFVDRLAAAGLDGQTIRNTVNTLRVIYRRACYQIPVNPSTGLEIVAPRNRQKRAVSAEVAAQMIAALEERPLRALRATAFYAGLRAGELVALRVEDVELFPDGRWGVIHVRHGMDKVEGVIDPKSEAGARTVPVCRQLYEVLAPYLARRSGLAFGRSTGTPFSYSGVRARTATALKNAGVEPHDLQFHECRHTYSSFLDAAGIPLTRADRYMGHADHSTPGRYRHQLEGQHLDDSLALTAYLDRADTPTRVRDNCATVSDSPERRGAVASGSDVSTVSDTQVSRTPQSYAESGSGSGGGGI